MSVILYFIVATIVPYSKERAMAMYTMKQIYGHIQVYDHKGVFLFSADNEREAREELERYEECAA